MCAVTGEALVDALVQLPPGAVVSAGATQATGITTRDCAAHGRPFAEVYASLLQLLQQRVEAAGPGAYLLLIGHNIRGEHAASVPGMPRPRMTLCAASCRMTLWLPASTHVPPTPAMLVTCPAFDLGILHRHAEVAGLPMLRHAHFLDTYALAKQVYPQVDVNDPQLPSDRKLQTLHTFLTGKEAQTAHRGAADCRTNLAVLRQLLGLVAAAGQIPGAGLRGGIDCLAWLCSRWHNLPRSRCTHLQTAETFTCACTLQCSSGQGLPAGWQPPLLRPPAPPPSSAARRRASAPASPRFRRSLRVVGSVWMMRWRSWWREMVCWTLRAADRRGTWRPGGRRGEALVGRHACALDACCLTHLVACPPSCVWPLNPSMPALKPSAWCSQARAREGAERGVGGCAAGRAAALQPAHHAAQRGPGSQQALLCRSDQVSRLGSAAGPGCMHGWPPSSPHCRLPLPVLQAAGGGRHFHAGPAARVLPLPPDQLPGRQAA